MTAAIKPVSFFGSFGSVGTSTNPLIVDTMAHPFLHASSLARYGY